MKKISSILRSQGSHWVGDGFPVRSIFSYNQKSAQLSPFLLMDYAGPARFEATEERRGVGRHPHRGFETVSIVYSGEVEHRDSSGGGGIIRPGDVQWMTAASGIVHEEFHSPEYAKRGGPFEMVQLWVNLPAKDKKAPAGYQNITHDIIPRVELPEGSGSVRVISGEFLGARGPARTFTPIDLWDVRLGAGRSAAFTVPAGHTTLVFVLAGRVEVAKDQQLGEAELAVLEREGEDFSLAATEAATLLILSGQPINEPVVGYGPFVMNTRAEIQQAFEDFQEL